MEALMRWFIAVGIVVLTIGCSSRQAAKDDSRETRKEESAAKDESIDRMKDDIAAKEKERAALAGENEKKKKEVEERRAELEKVKENLFVMGLGANYVSVRKEENHFRYVDGQLVNILQTVTDEGTKERLREIVRRQMEKDKGRDILTQCKNGYELCLDNQVYMYYGERDSQGNCKTEFYLIRLTCK
jgi:hypothetical protein